jgi:hypothetical protein
MTTNQPLTAPAVQAELAAIEARSIAERLGLLRATFPDVVADAERFLSHFWGMPYELVMIDAEDPAAALQDTYDLGFRRRRPPADEVSPLTDLLYEACELLMAHPPHRDRLLAELKRTHDERNIQHPSEDR